MGSDGRARRILLVEDHQLLRQALASILGQERGLTVVAQAGSLVEARGLLEGVDIAVVDPGLPDGDGTVLISELREASPGCASLVLTASLDRAYLARAVEAGAAGVIHKSVPLDEIIDAVTRVRAGETLLSAGQIIELMGLADRERERSAASRSLAERLTPREREILQALGEGLDDREIATRLGVADATERNYVSNLLTKLDAHSRLQALVTAIRHGLVELGPGDRRA